MVRVNSLFATPCGGGKLFNPGVDGVPAFVSFVCASCSAVGRLSNVRSRMDNLILESKILAKNLTDSVP